MVSVATSDYASAVAAAVKTVDSEKYDFRGLVVNAEELNDIPIETVQGAFAALRSPDGKALVKAHQAACAGHLFFASKGPRSRSQSNATPRDCQTCAGADEINFSRGRGVAYAACGAPTARFAARSRAALPKAENSPRAQALWRHLYSGCHCAP